MCRAEELRDHEFHIHDVGFVESPVEEFAAHGAARGRRLPGRSNAKLNLRHPRRMYPHNGIRHLRRAERSVPIPFRSAGAALALRECRSRTASNPPRAQATVDQLRRELRALE